MKARDTIPPPHEPILPAFNSLTVDGGNHVAACNLFYYSRNWLLMGGP